MTNSANRNLVMGKTLSYTDAWIKQNMSFLENIIHEMSMIIDESLWHRDIRVYFDNIMSFVEHSYSEDDVQDNDIIEEVAAMIDDSLWDRNIRVTFNNIMLYVEDSHRIKCASQQQQPPMPTDQDNQDPN